MTKPGGVPFSSPEFAAWLSFAARKSGIGYDGEVPLVRQVLHFIPGLAVDCRFDGCSVAGSVSLHVQTSTRQ
jgi:hypothetical protein